MPGRHRGAELALGGEGDGDSDDHQHGTGDDRRGWRRPRAEAVEQDEEQRREAAAQGNGKDRPTDRVGPRGEANPARWVGADDEHDHDEAGVAGECEARSGHG